MRRLAALVLAVVTAAAACTDGGADDDRLSVVVSLYPVEWLVEQLGGERVAVTNLAAAGAEAHDVELTAQDLSRVEEAALVVAVGAGFQPAVEDAAGRRPDGTRLVLTEHLAGPEDDPHFWLDPRAMAEAADLIADRLIEIDPEADGEYRERARALRSALDELHDRIDRVIATCDRDMVVSSHEAFGWFAARYGLRLEGIAGISPENEPTANRLAELRNEITRTGATTVFTEARVSSRVAETLAREAAVQTEVLDPLETLSDEQRDAGADYLSVMVENLQALARGLDCDMTVPAGMVP